MLHMNIRLLFLLILTISCNENYYDEYAVVSATKEADYIFFIHLMKKGYFDTIASYNRRIL